MLVTRRVIAPESFMYFTTIRLSILPQSVLGLPMLSLPNQSQPVNSAAKLPYFR